MYTAEVLEDIDEAHVPDVDTTPLKQVTSSRQTKAVKGRRLPTDTFTFELGSGCGMNKSTGHTASFSPVASLVLNRLEDIQLAIDVLESTTDNRL